MSVVVEALTKTYGSQNALDGLAFNIKSGETVGLLGPNGAGKSTTMKILTCFIPQTSGTATVFGFDVNQSPIDVRKNVGYLPESNPLYYDMYVKEYLDYVAGVYKIDNKPKRIAQMIDLTGLGIEQHKKIGQLSKGYKQRVGLAQAIIHDPKVLILDEPTSGLDPNQIVDIRNLIGEIGKEKTIILSTHIMQEVQAMCKRVIIINRGKLVADDNTATLQTRMKGGNTVKVEFANKVEKRELLALNGVSAAVQNGDSWEVSSSNKDLDLRKILFDFAVTKNTIINTLSQTEQSLEEIFRTLTSSTK
jgi:ABC-2 type transport system ATP-binding protein